MPLPKEKSRRSPPSLCAEFSITFWNLLAGLSLTFSFGVHALWNWLIHVNYLHVQGWKILRSGRDVYLKNKSALMSHLIPICGWKALMKFLGAVTEPRRSIHPFGPFTLFLPSWVNKCVFFSYTNLFVFNLNLNCTFQELFLWVSCCVPLV